MKRSRLRLAYNDSLCKISTQTLQFQQIERLLFSSLIRLGNFIGSNMSNFQLHTPTIQSIIIHTISQCMNERDRTELLLLLLLLIASEVKFQWAADLNVLYTCNIGPFDHIHNLTTATFFFSRPLIEVVKTTDRIV